MITWQPFKIYTRGHVENLAGVSEALVCGFLQSTKTEDFILSDNVVNEYASRRYFRQLPPALQVKIVDLKRCRW